MTNIEQITPFVRNFSGTEDNKLAATLYTPETDHGHPPCLFMHGGGQTRHSWDGACVAIAQLGLTAITVDARGHGDSEWVNSKDYSFSYFRDDLIKLAGDIKAEFGKAPILVGASMGGISAMVAQHKAGADLFSAIVLVDITPRMEQSGVNKIMGFMAQDMEQGFATIEDAANTISAYLPNRKRPKSLDGLKKNLRLRDNGRWYWHWDPAFVEGARPVGTDRDERLERLQEACRTIKVPALLVRGRQSELVSEEAAQEFLDLVPHAKYVDVNEAGHMVAGDKNDIFADAVISFLQEDVLASAA